jgi:hypothetical protein
MMDILIIKGTIFWFITPCRALLATCFHAGILLGLIFDPEVEGDMFLINATVRTSNLPFLITPHCYKS